MRPLLPPRAVRRPRARLAPLRRRAAGAVRSAGVPSARSARGRRGSRGRAAAVTVDAAALPGRAAAARWSARCRSAFALGVPTAWSQPRQRRRRGAGASRCSTRSTRRSVRRPAPRSARRAGSGAEVRYEVTAAPARRARFGPPSCACAPSPAASNAHRGRRRATRASIPNFAAVARYAWLAGDRRLAEIGIKSYPLRGRAPTSSSSPTTAPATRSATSTGRRRCAWAADRARVPGRARPERRLPARLRPPHARRRGRRRRRQPLRRGAQRR